MSMLKATALVVCSAGIAGCLTSNVLVTVRPDMDWHHRTHRDAAPSAMAELEKLLSPEIADRPASPPQTLKEMQYRGQNDWGRSVRLRSATPIKGPDTVGWRTTYDYDSVADLDVDLMPRVPGMHAFYSLAATDSAASTWLRMSLAPAADGVEMLTVHFPHFDMDTSAESLATSVSGSTAETATLRSMLEGARVTVAIETETTLLRTNSPHREQNRVTLFDADIERALSSRQIGTLVSSPATFDGISGRSAICPACNSRPSTT